MCNKIDSINCYCLQKIIIYRLLEIKGTAESNTRVSAFMRNIDKSEWLEAPDLKVVEVKDGDGRGGRASEFTVFAQQVKNEEEES